MTSRFCDVCARMASCVALTSSSKVELALPFVVGRVTDEVLKPSALRRVETLSQMEAECHAPGTRTKAGLLVMLWMLLNLHRYGGSEMIHRLVRIGRLYMPITSDARTIHGHSSDTEQRSILIMRLAIVLHGVSTSLLFTEARAVGQIGLDCIVRGRIAAFWIRSTRLVSLGHLDMILELDERTHSDDARPYLHAASTPLVSPAMLPLATQ